MKHLLFLFLLFSAAGLSAQRGEVLELPLQDLSGFRSQAGNWRIVEEVVMDPSVDIHEKPAPPLPVEEPVKRRGKKRKPIPEVPPVPEPAPQAVTFQPGTGILLNINNDSLKDHLLTDWEHGDIILDLEVMLPKGSNSGIYLQGRYEVQLYDSWGVRDPSFSDMGGIYRNWERTPGKTYRGKAPLVNASRAPGLWQHLRIGFRAPRFDADGRKKTNARFVFVDLNGVRIHENLEVPMPTGGPVSKEETARGPLLIQGDHGPVAFRRIKVQHLRENDLRLTAIRYRVFDGNFQESEDLTDVTPAATGELDRLTAQVADEDEAFTAVYEGMIEASAAGVYDLQLRYYGGAKLVIGDQVIDGRYTRRGDESFTVELPAGQTPFQLFYFKRNARWPSRLGLFDAGSFPRPLHAFDSFAPLAAGSRIYVDVENQPRLLRAFLDFAGDRNQRLTHTIAVGGTGGLHYVYDLKTGSIACVWRGEFMDATPMWNSRGDGSFRPRGDVQYLFRGLSVARLENPDADFPRAMDEKDGFRNKGYRIDEPTGLPVFLYDLDTLAMNDWLEPDIEGRGITRTVRLDKTDAVGNLYLKLAEGEQIQPLPGGAFVVDQSYYVRPADGVEARIRESQGRKELIAPFVNQTLAYIIQW